MGLTSAFPAVWSLPLCALIGLILAMLFRRAVVGPLTPEGGFLIAVLVPLAGALLFVWSATLGAWAVQGFEAPENMAPVAFSLLVLSAGTVVYVPLKAYFVLVPMGLLSLVLLRWVGKRTAAG